MNKNLIIAGVVAAVILIAIGGFLLMGQKKITSSVTQNPVPTKQEDKTLFTSIKDALSKSLSLECGFKDEAGRETKSYIKNGAVRADMMGSRPEETGSVIIKDKKMYYWTGQTGFMAEILDVTPAVTGAQPNTKQGVTEEQNIMESLEKYKNDCKTAIVADALFTPPTNVKFQDYSQMMKKIPNPSGTNMMPSGVPTEYQQYMQRASPAPSTPAGQ